MQKEIHDNTPVGKPEKIIKPYSTIYEERKGKLLNKIITSPPNTPNRFCTFRQDTLHPKQIEDKPGVKRRRGQPRVRWVETGLSRLWTIIGNRLRADLKYSVMDLNKPDHVDAIIRAAEIDLHEEEPGKIIRGIV
eukprot:4547733-Karenia_brevis.AAC.1